MSILFCSISECERKIHARGLCNPHYRQQLSGKEFKQPRRRKLAGEDFSLCSFSECKNVQSYKDGLCDAHGWQAKNGKELSALRKREKAKDIQKFCRIDGCGRKFMAKSLCGKHYNIERTYKIPAETYEGMLASCSGLCQLCNGKPVGIGNTLHVDHNHVTGKIRGLLCSNCNTSLGGFQDNQEVLLKAIDYLKKHS